MTATISLPKDPKNSKEIPEPREGETPSDISSPELDKDGKPTKKAIQDAKQAHAIAKRTYDRAKLGRIEVAAQVARKYGGEQPFKPGVLAALNQTWRNNFTTHFLASIVDRAKPQIVDPIKDAMFLTYSALPPGRENSDKKTTCFRTRMTKLIRSWNGWVNFVDIVSQENYLNGNAAPTYIDDDWRPKAWRFDEVFLPEGVGQHAANVPFIVIRQPILLHELIEKISNKEAAELAGYNIPGCIEAINEATGLRDNADRSAMEDVDRWREQGSLKGTYDAEEVKVVWMYHVIVKEWLGNVALWTVAEKGEHELRHVEEFAENMEEVTTLFTLQTGNEKFYGSKGAGRMLANIHIAIERGRNMGADQLNLSGCPILQSGDADVNSVQISVRHPFMIVPKAVTVTKEMITFDVQAFQYMDDKLVSIAESIAGAFIPPNVDPGGGAGTRIAAAQKAARELAVRNGVLGRFFQQFGEQIGAMQRRICKPENLKEAVRIYEEDSEKQKKGIRVLTEKVYNWLMEVIGKKKRREGAIDPSKIEKASISRVADPEAVECLVNLLRDTLTPQDIIELALSPAGNDVENQTEEEEGKLLGFIQSKAQVPSPFLDQKEMAAMEAEAVLGEEGARRILVKDKEDPNLEAIAYRQQVIELSEMLDGEEMPVAITDNHPLHRKTLKIKMGPLFANLEQAPSQKMLETCKMVLNHYVEHLSQDMQTPMSEKQAEMEPLKQLEEVINNAETIVGKMAEQAAAAGIPGGADAVPSLIAGQPMQAGPNGSMGENEVELEKDKAAAEIILRKGDQEIEHRKLDVKEKEIAQKDEHQTLSSVTQAGLEIAKTIEQSRKEGSQAAENDLRQEQGIDSSAPKP